MELRVIKWLFAAPDNDCITKHNQEIISCCSCFFQTWDCDGLRSLCVMQFLLTQSMVWIGLSDKNTETRKFDWADHSVICDVSHLDISNCIYHSAITHWHNTWNLRYSHPKWEMRDASVHIYASQYFHMNFLHSIVRPYHLFWSMQATAMIKFLKRFEKSNNNMKISVLTDFRRCWEPRKFKTIVSTCQNHVTWFISCSFNVSYRTKICNRLHISNSLTKIHIWLYERLKLL